jgi:hypothetical protein
MLNEEAEPPAWVNDRATLLVDARRIARKIEDARAPSVR